MTRLKKRTFDSHFRGYPLASTFKSNEGFFVYDLERTFNIMNYQIYKHCKVFFIRFDLRYPESNIVTDQHATISNFLANLMVHFKRTRRSTRTDNLIGNYDAKYIRTKEWSKQNQRPHHHLALLLNGSRNQNAFGIQKKVAEDWCRFLGVEFNLGLVDLPLLRHGYPYGGIMIQRTDPYFQTVFSECFKYASYLCKVYSKRFGMPYDNNFRTSKLPQVDFEDMSRSLHPHLRPSFPSFINTGLAF